MRRLPTWASLALAATGTTACDWWGPSGRGVIEVTVVSPYGPEGAAVLELTGGIGFSVVATEAGDSFYEHDGEVTRVAVVLEQPGTIVFTVRAEDIGELPSGTLLQVADGNNRLRSDLSGYEFEFRQIEEMTSERHWRAP